MRKTCLNCHEEDTSKLVGDLCKACIAGGVTLKGRGVLLEGKTISGAKSIANKVLPIKIVKPKKKQ